MLFTIVIKVDQCLNDVSYFTCCPHKVLDACTLWEGRFILSPSSRAQSLRMGIRWQRQEAAGHIASTARK